MPTAAAPFVGRSRELAVLLEQLERAKQGSGGLVFVVGELGIGKTRLTREFLTAAADRGCHYFTGAAPMTAAKMPFGAVVSALKLDLQHRGNATLDSLPAYQRVELTRLLPEFDGAGGEAIDDEFLASPQLATYEAIWAYVRQATATNEPGVVLLEDLHWADSATTDLLAYVAPDLAGEALLVVATVRAETLRPSSALRRWFLELARLDHVHVLELSGLAREDARAIARTVAGSDAPARALEVLVDRSGGNPYFVVELAASLADGQQVVPASLQALLEERLSDLNDVARHVARTAAADGIEGSVKELDLASALRPDVAETAIRELRDRAILDAGAKWRFRHPLLAEMLYADLLPVERAHIHRRWAEVLESAGDARDPGVLQGLARHWYEAGDSARALPALTEAAAAAARLHAFSLAHVLYERAIAVQSVLDRAEPQSENRIGFRPATPTTRSDDTGELLERAAEAAGYAGAPDRAAELIRLRLASVGDPERRASLRERLAGYLFESGRETDGLDEYSAALDELAGQPSALAARVLGGKARAQLLAGLHSEGTETARRALETAVAERSVADEYRARVTLAACLALSGAMKEAMNELDTARRLEELLGSASQVRASRIVDLLAGQFSAATVLTRAGDFEASAEAAHTGRERAKRLGVRTAWGGLLGDRAAGELFELGRWTELEDLGQELTQSQTEAEIFAGQVSLSRINTARAEIEAAARLLEAARPAMRGVRMGTARFHRATAELAIVRADWQTAIGAVDEGLADTDLRQEMETTVELAALGLRAAAEQLDTARLRRSSAEITELRAHAKLYVGLSKAGADGAPDIAAGARSAAFAKLAEAEAHRLEPSPDPNSWGEVASRFEQLRAPHRVAYARYRQAEALAMNSERKSAAEQLQGSWHIARELGAQHLVEEIDALSRRARLELDRGHETAPSETAHYSTDLGLSARELEVLGLLAEGKTNREIGEALFITEKTAGHHVSSILSKLGVRGRVEAAALAVKVGLYNGPEAAAEGRI